MDTKPSQRASDTDTLKVLIDSIVVWLTVWSSSEKERRGYASAAWVLFALGPRF